jgi:hypothetical protein
MFRETLPNSLARNPSAFWNFQVIPYLPSRQTIDRSCSLSQLAKDRFVRKQGLSIP